MRAPDRELLFDERLEPQEGLVPLLRDCLEVVPSFVQNLGLKAEELLTAVSLTPNNSSTLSTKRCLVMP